MKNKLNKKLNQKQIAIFRMSPVQLPVAIEDCTWLRQGFLRTTLKQAKTAAVVILLAFLKI